MTDEPKPKRRIPSIMGDDARAETGREARESRRTPREGVPSAEFDAEENSQNYNGEQLREYREARPIDSRVSRLEVKHDELARVVTEIKSDVKRVATASDTMVGKLDTFMEMQSQMQTQPRADSLMRVVRETATETTTATLASRVLDEQDKSRKFRRTFILSSMKIIAGLVSAGGVGALVHYFLEKL